MSLEARTPKKSLKMNIVPPPKIVLKLYPVKKNIKIWEICTFWPLYVELNSEIMRQRKSFKIVPALNVINSRKKSHGNWINN